MKCFSKCGKSNLMFHKFSHEYHMKIINVTVFNSSFNLNNSFPDIFLKIAIDRLRQLFLTNMVEKDLFTVCLKF